jgi:hypothetical protein
MAWQPPTGVALHKWTTDVSDKFRYRLNHELILDQVPLGARSETEQHLVPSSMWKMIFLRVASPPSPLESVTLYHKLRYYTWL